MHVSHHSLPNNLQFNLKRRRNVYGEEILGGQSDNKQKDRLIMAIGKICCGKTLQGLSIGDKGCISSIIHNELSKQTGIFSTQNSASKIYASILLYRHFNEGKMPDGIAVLADFMKQNFSIIIDENKYGFFVAKCADNYLKQMQDYFFGQSTGVLSSHGTQIHSFKRLADAFGQPLTGEQTIRINIELKYAESKNYIAAYRKENFLNTKNYDCGCYDKFKQWDTANKYLQALIDNKTLLKAEISKINDSVGIDNNKHAAHQPLYYLYMAELVKELTAAKANLRYANNGDLIVETCDKLLLAIKEEFAQEDHKECFIFNQLVATKPDFL